jgi:tungstate transport system permease protein
MNEIIDITLRSIWISGCATLIAFFIGIPLAYILAYRRRVELISSIIESLVGIPTVVLGLFLYFLFSKSGPLGFLNLLYTPQAIIIGESILIIPLIISTSFRILKNTVYTYGEFAIAIGATKTQKMILILKESYLGLLASFTMAFSRAIGELGIALMIGGNIKDFTRVMTTAIALGVSKGEFESSLLLGCILVIIMIVISVILRIISRGIKY